MGATSTSKFIKQFPKQYHLIVGYMKTHFNKNLRSQRQEKNWCFFFVFFFPSCLDILLILNSYNLEFRFNFFKISFSWSSVALVCVSLVSSKVSQLCIYIYPLFFGLPVYLGHHRALSSFLCYTVGFH